MAKPQSAPANGKSKLIMRGTGGRSSTKARGAGAPAPSKSVKPRPQASDSDGHDDESDPSESGSEDSEPDTEDEIRAANAAPKSKKTQKRKRRAVSPSAFGEALVGLLGPSAPRPAPLAPEQTEDTSSQEEAIEGSSESDRSEPEEESDEEDKPAKRARTSPHTAKPAPNAPGPILALAPHIKRADAKASLVSRAERELIAERKKAYELTHVKDPISAWGPPGQIVNYDGDLVPALGAAPMDAVAQGAWDDQGGSGGYEKRLRKVAQRGVVKLFNVIRDTQRKAAAPPEAEEQSGLVRSIMGKPPLPPGTKKSLDSKDSFLDLIKTAGKR